MPRLITLTALTLALSGALAAPASAQSFGKLSGTVVDPAGTPQMGASVAVSQNGQLIATEAIQLLTNQKGTFLAQRLVPGVYTVRVTLAGFLPALERNVRVEANLTTILKIEMGSVFATMDSLRRKPGAEKADADEWAWVLRTSAASRSCRAQGEPPRMNCAPRPISFHALRRLISRARLRRVSANWLSTSRTGPSPTLTCRRPLET